MTLTRQQSSAQRAGVGKATVTGNGRALAEKLSPAIGTTHEIQQVCSLICRHAGTLQRLTEEECNGPDWMDSSDRSIGRLWQTFKELGGSFPVDDETALPAAQLDAYRAARAAVVRHSERMERWTAEREAREELLESRLAWLIEFLPATDDGPWAPILGGDPRGCVAIVGCPPAWAHLADDFGHRGICVPYNRAY